MSSVVIAGNTSGSITLAAPDVAGTTTLTLPTTNGTVLTTGSTFAGTGPAFSAYGSAYQNATTVTQTKIAFNTKEFDTNTNYDTTLYRFTPTVAGYYQINAIITVASSASGYINMSLYKNGSAFKQATTVANNNIGPNISLSTLVYANGSTDYFEIYGYQNSGGTIQIGSANSQFTFSGALVRAA